MKNVFLITSVIDVSQKPLSYSKTRSVFSLEERIFQTLETINSIRGKNESIEIILFEAGNTDYRNLFESKVEKYFFLNRGFRKKLVNSKFKGLGEIVMILSVSRHLKKLNFDQLFKISGRYELSENFDAILFDNKKFNFLIYQSNNEKKKHSKLITYITILYSVPKIKMTSFIFKLYLIIPLTLLNLSIEQIFPLIFCLNRINQIKKLGVKGLISVNGELVEY